MTIAQLTTHIERGIKEAETGQANALDSVAFFRGAHEALLTVRNIILEEESKPEEKPGEEEKQDPAD